MVVAVGEGEYVLPVANAVPPLDAANQFTVPDVAVADNSTAPDVVHFCPLVTAEI